MPDFPNELVEAAAKAAMEAEPGQNWECATAKEADVYLRDSLAVLAVVVPLIEQRARLDERERLSSRVHENGWCPTCARDTDEAAMQRLSPGKSLESLSRNDLIGLALRNLNAAMDAEARADAAEQRVIDRLAREAGERQNPHYNPSPEWAAWHNGYTEGAACGVAAERARTEALREALEDLIDRQHDHPSELNRGQREWWRSFDRARAALSPERTTTTEDE